MNKKQNTILIDLTSLCRKCTGIEKYAKNFALELLRSNSNIDFILVFRKFIDPDFKQIFISNVTFIISPFKSQLITEQFFIPYIIFLKKPSYSVFPAFPPGLFAVSSIIFMCYDATMWKYPQYLSLKNKIYFKPLSNIALHRAKHVFTCSNSSANELIFYFSVLRNKIHSISAALPSICFNSIKQKCTLEKLRINKKYLFSVGSLEPRKNIPFLLKSITSLLLNRNLLLVLAGRKAWGNSPIQAEIASLGISSHVIMTDYVSENELQHLYAGAEVFIFPSLYEGFGFPILEAFSCHCPVITSNTSSMPEVAGDAAILINPQNADEICNAVVAILENPQLRQDLINKGMNRLKEFSWEKTTKLFMESISHA